VAPVPHLLHLQSKRLLGSTPYTRGTAWVRVRGDRAIEASVPSLVGKLLVSVATCYSPDFREFLHCPTPISHAATKMTRGGVILRCVPTFIMRVLLAALFFLHY
jgi:hypothetical protein